MDEIVNILVEYARRPYDRERDFVKECMEALAPLNDILSGLTAALSHPDERVRMLTLELLEAWGADAEPALPELIRSLNDADETFQQAALRVVVKFGAKAQAAVPILETWLTSPVEFSWIAGNRELFANDPNDPPESLAMALSISIKGLPLKKILASQAIYAITGDPRDAIRIGLNLLGDIDWFERCIGAKFLGSIGSKARSAEPRLRRALFDQDARVRSLAKRALDEIQYDLASDL
ncbi:MAG TPA: HEAT repeat domain-containing protein [Planctomycetaceae bacterium]|jgi:HEAT repeat protein|nr:HEAT repeat domain-containing protein [Planctomycetaceae bacterium]